MKSKNADIFSSNNLLKILSYLAENPAKELLGGEIQKAACISRTGVYIALRELVKYKLVYRDKRGKSFFYYLRHECPIIKQFKVLKNVLLLQNLIERLKSASKKIILYGSAERGEDYPDSDMDLFIVSKAPQIVKKIIPSVKIKRKLQAIIKTPSEFSDIKHTDEIFYQEISRGIVLWEDNK